MLRISLVMYRRVIERTALISPRIKYGARCIYANNNKACLSHTLSQSYEQFYPGQHELCGTRTAAAAAE